MRTVLALLLVVSFSTDAFAKKHHRARHKKRAHPVHVVRNDTAAQDYQRAEAQLAELRSAKELPAAQQADEPAQVRVEQANDSETPPALRK
jgi:hypothetical protein